MAGRRRYARASKVTAILAAAASSTLAAAQETGIPESTIRYWLDDPQFAKLRDNAREAMGSEANVVARLVWQKFAEAVMSGEISGPELVTAAAVATDKALLLSGEATARTETKTLTDGLDDHERATLRDLIDRALAPALAEGDSV